MQHGWYMKLSQIIISIMIALLTGFILWYFNISPLYLTVLCVVFSGLLGLGMGITIADKLNGSVVKTLTVILSTVLFIVISYLALTFIHLDNFVLYFFASTFVCFMFLAAFNLMYSNADKKQIIKMPKDLRTPLKQYLVFFNDFVKKTKGKDAGLEIHDHKEGLELIFKINDNSNIEDIYRYFSEYIGFTKYNLDNLNNLNVQFEVDASTSQVDLIMIDLRNQLRNLKTSLEIRDAENRMLNGENQRLLGLLEIHFSTPQPINLNQSQTNSVNVSVEINQYFPEIQSNFNELKNILITANSQHKEELKDISDSLDEITPSSDKDKLIKPLNKLRRFLIDLSNPESEYNKIIKGSARGIALASKLLEGYNKIAPYINIQTIEPLLRHL